MGDGFKMKFQWNGYAGYIDGWLATQLDSLVYNIKHDWDFVILITGDRMVRVGKSVLAQNVCAYLAWRLSMYLKTNIRYDINDIYFDSESMVKDAKKKPKFSINHYDEAREALAASKHTMKIQQDLIDFFNECGQLNQIFVLVLPDYFSLKEEVAVGRSEILLNVYRSEKKKMIDLYKTGEKIPVVDFKRGQFEFFSRRKKQRLYDTFYSTRKKNYFAVRADIIGSFSNHYLVDEMEYREKKLIAMERFKSPQKPERLSTAEKFYKGYLVKKRREGLGAKRIVKEIEKDAELPLHYSTILNHTRELGEIGV